MIDQKIIDSVLEQIGKRTVNYEYFFAQLTSPVWIRPLHEHGLFRNPPVPEEEGEFISFPFWPETQYLARMASQAPDIVLEIALQIPDTENTRVYEDLTDAANAMPAQLSVRLLPKLIHALELPYQLLIPDKLGQLVGHLAKSGYVEDALELARALLTSVCGLDMPSEEAEHDASVRPAGARFEVGQWACKQFVENHIPTLIDAAGIDGVCMLADLLENAILISVEPPSSSDKDDVSYIWRQAIEDDDEFAHDVRNLLVSALRDAAGKRMSMEGKQVLALLEKRHATIFRRIAIHLRRLWPHADLEGTAGLLDEYDLLDNTGLWHELFHLLKEQFGDLPLSAQQAYLAFVDQGAHVGIGHEFNEEITGDTLAPEECDGYARRWRYRLLIPIADYLDDEWRGRYEGLWQEFGKLDHPDFHFYVSAGWVGPTSPIGEDELAAMSVEEIALFLASWTPSDDWMEPQPEGLGRQMEAVVAEQPQRFAQDAHLFEGLDPTYVRALLQGLQKAVAQDLTFEWEPVIALCSWAVTQPREVPGRAVVDGDADPGWGWTRQAIASLLARGLGEGVGEIPYALRQLVWRVIEALAEDPDPTPEHEAQYGGTNMGPETLAINSVRGEAMRAVILYGLWVRRHIEQECYAPEDTREVVQVLERHLDLEVDPSLAIRSIYGRFFPWIAYIDQDWAQANLDRIFPGDEALTLYRETAWASYIVFCGPSAQMLEMLDDEYSAAIERIGTADPVSIPFANPDAQLAAHLMGFYWWGVLCLDTPDSLLSRFYEKADDGLRAHAMRELGHGLQSVSAELDPQIATRLRAHWEQRLEIVHSDPATSGQQELAAFGWWFASGKLDETWLLSQLRTVLVSLAGMELEAIHEVAERLAELCSRFPGESLELLESLVGQSPERSYYSWRDPARQILAATLADENADIRESAQRLVNRLGAMRYLEFRDLLGH